MKHNDYTTMIEITEMLISHETEDMIKVFTSLLNLAMRIEREKHLVTKNYERSVSRQGYANAYTPRRLNTEVGIINVDMK